MPSANDLFLKTFAPGAMSLSDQLGPQSGGPLQDTLMRNLEARTRSQAEFDRIRESDPGVVEAWKSLAPLAATSALPGPAWLRILNVLDSVSPKPEGVAMGTLPVGVGGPIDESELAKAGKRAVSGPERDSIVGDLYSEVGKAAKIFGKKAGLQSQEIEDLHGNSVLKLIQQLEDGVPAAITDPKDLRSYLMGSVQNHFRQAGREMESDVLGRKLSQSIDEGLGSGEDGPKAPPQVAEGGQVSKGSSDVGRILRQEAIPAAPESVPPIVEALERLRTADIKGSEQPLVKRLYERGLSRADARATGIKFSNQTVTDLRLKAGADIATDAEIYKGLGITEPQIREAVNNFIDKQIASNRSTNLKNLRNTAVDYLVNGPPKLSPRQLAGRSGSSAESLFRRLKIISNGVKGSLLPNPDDN